MLTETPAGQFEPGLLESDNRNYCHPQGPIPNDSGSDSR